MKPSVKADRCPQNHSCPLVRLCPVGAISQRGYSAPTIDPSRCTGCGVCSRSCAFRAVQG